VGVVRAICLSFVLEGLALTRHDAESLEMLCGQRNGKSDESAWQKESRASLSILIFSTTAKGSLSGSLWRCISHGFPVHSYSFAPGVFMSDENKDENCFRKNIV
jgi:hypothetical protein